MDTKELHMKKLFAVLVILIAIPLSGCHLFEKREYFDYEFPGTGETSPLPSDSAIPTLEMTPSTMDSPSPEEPTLPPVDTATPEQPSAGPDDNTSAPPTESTQPMAEGPSDPEFVQ